MRVLVTGPRTGKCKHGDIGRIYLLQNRGEVLSLVYIYILRSQIPAVCALSTP